MTDSPTSYCRDDLETLRSLSPDQVLTVLGSFAGGDAHDSAWILRAARLLDGARIPDLTAAAEARDVEAVLTAVWSACQDRLRPPPPPQPTVVEQAEALLANRFTFYGETHQLPADIDWDHNPGTGHWGHDLNRFGFLVPLVDAFHTTGEPSYARKAAALILDWIDKCDMGRCFEGTPYVFGSYLNNAIHCAAWTQALRTLVPARILAPAQLLRVLKSLHEQMAYLRIVTGGHQGNWPTIGCQGILQVLAALPMFAATDGLVGYCIDTLARQVDEQVLPDGVQDELTPHYHTVVINNLLTAIECLQRLEGQLRPETTVTLEAMVRYQQQTVVPDGSAQVAFNDSDPAAVPKVAARLQRLGLSHYLRPAADLGSEVYPYAGVAFLRQPATEGDLYLAFDGGPFGRAHQHEDMLAFWLHAYGRNHLVDPGRHLYDSSDASYRGYLSSTQAHSTITIDGCGQHARGRPENWIASEPTGLGLVVTATQVRAAATYDLGYGPDNDIEVAHHRQIVFAEQRFWIIVDTVSAAAVDGRHRIESRFQFGPGDLRLDDDGRARTTHDDANLLLWTSAGWDAQQVLTGSETPGGGWYSPSYGRLEPAPCLCLERSAQLPFRSATLLYPYRGATPPAVDFAWADGVATVSSAEVGKVRIEAEPSGEPL